MNKKSIITVLMAIAAINVEAQFFFRISGGGLENPSYMLGTIHTLPGSLLDSIPAYLEAEAKCGQLYAEMEIDNQQRMTEIKDKGKQTLKLPDGKTIFDIMSKEQFELLNEKSTEAFHLNLKDSASSILWDYQPQTLENIFSQFLDILEMRKHPELGIVAPGTAIDATCLTRAKQRGVKIGELDEIQSEESLKELQTTMLANLDAQVDSLMSFIQNIDQYRQKTAQSNEALVRGMGYWKQGDYESFSKDEFFLKDLENFPVIYKQRNEKWLPKMLTAMREVPTLFVFGCCHLIGSDGIVQKLRDAGYKVEQMKR